MTPRSVRKLGKAPRNSASGRTAALKPRSEEHTSELQSRSDLECRLLLVKNKRPTDRAHCVLVRNPRGRTTPHASAPARATLAERGQRRSGPDARTRPHAPPAAPVSLGGC